MSNKAAKLIILFSLLFNIYTNAQDTSLINKSRRTTLQIIAYNKGQQIGTGTGFFVNIQGATFILTCFHVVGVHTLNSRGEIIGVTFYDSIIGKTYNGKEIQLKTYFKNKNNLDPAIYDFAFLINRDNKSFIDFKNVALDVAHDFYVGESVYFTGYPFNIGMLSNIGMISGFDGVDSTTIFIQSLVNYGNSGGALINNKGKVVGIISRKSLSNFSLDFKSIVNKLDSQQAIIGNNTFYEKGAGGALDDVPKSDIKYHRNLINALNQNINTGIGGAVFIKHAYHYITTR